MKIEGDVSKMYEVNSNGAIKIYTISDESVFDLAKQCDTDENGLLEFEEIVTFSRKFPADLRHTKRQVIYSKQYGKNGELEKKCIVAKNDGSQFVYSYKEGKPIGCILIRPNGEKNIISLRTGICTRYENEANSQEYEKIKISEDDLDFLMSVANEESECLDNGILGFFKSLFD